MTPSHIKFQHVNRFTPAAIILLKAYIEVGIRISPVKNQEGSPFIAPDESYLIFSRQAEGTRKADLYISFRGADGKWSQAQDMGENINTPTNDLAAKVTPEGRYIFFLSQVDVWPRIHWVDATIIDSIRAGWRSEDREDTSPAVNASP